MQGPNASPVLPFLGLLALSAIVGSCAKEPAGRPFNAPAATGVAPSSSSEAELVRSAGEPGKRPDQVGTATWYGRKFAGKKTASGERFDPDAMTAAHRKLPFGTWVEVRRIDTGTSVRVRITDRGPHGDAKRIIDLSRAAAQRLGLIHDGAARVELRVVNGPE